MKRFLIPKFEIFFQRSLILKNFLAIIIVKLEAANF